MKIELLCMLALGLAMYVQPRKPSKSYDSVETRILKLEKKLKSKGVKNEDNK